MARQEPRPTKAFALVLVAQSETGERAQAEDQRGGFEPFAHENDGPDRNPDAEDNDGEHDYFSTSSFHKLKGNIGKANFERKHLIWPPIEVDRSRAVRDVFKGQTVWKALSKSSPIFTASATKERDS